MSSQNNRQRKTHDDTTHVKHMLSYLHGDMKVSDIHKGTFLLLQLEKETERSSQRRHDWTRIFNDTNVHCHIEGFTEVSDKIEIRKFDRVKLQANVRRDTLLKKSGETHKGMRSFCKEEL